MQDYHIPLFPDKTYHVLSRAIGSEKLFREKANYQFFLRRYHQYISPIAGTYCYCLLPNHFHFLLKIKCEAAIASRYHGLNKKNFSAEKAPGFIMQQFSNFLNSYTKSFNKMYNRMGGLFIDYMRRVELETDRQFGATVFYIHKNPVHHGYCKKIDGWDWSSFNTLISDKPTTLLRQEVMDWFGGPIEFLRYHSQPIYLKGAAQIE